MTALLVKQLGLLERDGGRVDGYTGSLYTLDDFRIAGYNRTVVTVLFVAFSFEYDKRQENAVYSVFHQILYMRVYQFGRKTDIVGHHHACIPFVFPVV